MSNSQFMKRDYLFTQRTDDVLAIVTNTAAPRCSWVRFQIKEAYAMSCESAAP